MPALDDLRDAFRSALDLDPGHAIDGLAYRTIEQWDSVAHMVLVAELEDRFDVMFETDDVIDMSSFEKAVSILSKYGVDFE
jgi:acyl carrier protein